MSDQPGKYRANIQTSVVVGGTPEDPTSGRVVQISHPVAPSIVTPETANAKTCRNCRNFRLEAGQKHLLKQRFWQGIVKELSYSEHWHDPAKFGLCVVTRNSATHEDATCEAFQPIGRIASFFGMRNTR